MYRSKRSDLHLSILKEIGQEVDSKKVVLDFGCGNGNVVKDYRLMGLEAYGCDLEFKEGENVEELVSKGAIKLIDGESYRLPFDDGFFDVVVSDQVFEHVQDYPAVLSELKRVLKPGGVALHVFPARYNLIEPHVYVPLASFVQSYWWLLLWALLGVKNEFQKDISRIERAKTNFSYLHNCTNYLRKRDIVSYGRSYFKSVRFAELELLKHSSAKSRIIFKVSKFIKFIPALYSAFRCRVMVLQ